MYNPSHFCVTDPDALHALVCAFPFATLVNSTASGLDANHLPFELLHARPMAAPAWLPTCPAPTRCGSNSKKGAVVLAIFRAEDACVSPTGTPASRKRTSRC